MTRASACRDWNGFVVRSVNLEESPVQGKPPIAHY